MDSLLALERTPAVLLILALAVAAYLLVTPRARPLPDIPWVGKSSRLPGADTWATLASFVNRRKWFAEGYQKVSLAVTSPVLGSFLKTPLYSTRGTARASSCPTRWARSTSRCRLRS